MSDLYAEALSTFAGLFEEAKQSREVEPNAMTVATADTQGRPSARTVLLKAFDERGFVFYTHLDSQGPGTAGQSAGRAVVPVAQPA